MELNKVECGKCHHNWIPRTDNPLRCPVCKTNYWKPKESKRNLRNELTIQAPEEL